jgi:stress responsive alpha/beta barrel protein
MFVHAVYFWLRPDLTPAQRAQFVAGVRSLGTIQSVQQCYIGVPAPTDRPVIDRTYSQALVLVFADQAAHDTYQVHPIHERFRTECGTFWTSVRIFDSVSEVSGPAPSSAAG